MAALLSQATQGQLGAGRGLLRGGQGGEAVQQGQETAGPHGYGSAGLPHGQHGQAPLRDHQGEQADIHPQKLVRRNVTVNA